MSNIKKLFGIVPQNETTGFYELHIGTLASWFFDGIRISLYYLRAVGESPSIFLFGLGLYLKEITRNLKNTIVEGKVSYKEVGT